MDRDGGNKTQKLYRHRSKGLGSTGSTLLEKLLTTPKLITFWYLLRIINYNAISIERLP